MQNSTKGPQVILSRRSDDLVRRLFELEVPEISDGLVEIKNVAREPGFRCKIAVISHADGVDPVGACVGPRGSRVRMVVSELRGERIDIVPVQRRARALRRQGALAGARARGHRRRRRVASATIIVPDDQLSLAIGKEGQNARLASKLTGWRIDIKSQSEMADNENELVYADDGDGGSGHCVAVMSNGKRCPNMALPGSRYCGIHARTRSWPRPRPRVRWRPSDRRRYRRRRPQRTCVGCRTGGVRATSSCG